MWPIAGCALTGALTLGWTGMWYASNQPDGWRWILVLGATDAALGAFVGGLLGAVLF
jgi:hypothetical protein